MDLNNLFAASIYEARRSVLRSSVGSGRIILLGNNESSVNFKDNWYPFRQDSSFLYYFGLSQPDLVGIIDCDNETDIIIGNELTIDDIIWTGPLPSLQACAERVGIRQVISWTDYSFDIRQKHHFLPPYRGDHTFQLMNYLAISKEEVESGYSIPLVQSIVKQRNIKSSEEIKELHKAVDVTSAMHLAVMEAARPSMKEYELVGVAAKVAYDHNVHMSFAPILTIDGQTLHNHYHGNTIKDGDMVLFDGGVESPLFYAGDMTRTFPVSGSFTTKQKEIYDAVYQAHELAIMNLKPGILFRDIHLMAAAKLVEGFIDIGLMKGNAEEAVRAGAHTMFFQCGLGHMMGLDVHDMENLGEQYVGYTPDLIKSTAFGLKSLRLGKALEEGNVLTVEPGAYFIPALIDKCKAEGLYQDFIHYDVLETYRNFGGIRVEEDFVIRNNGPELLGKALVKSSDAIESVRKKALA